MKTLTEYAKMSKNVMLLPLHGRWTAFGQCLDIFGAFIRPCVMILFYGLSNDLPVTTLIGHWPGRVYPCPI